MKQLRPGFAVALALACVACTVGMPGSPAPSAPASPQASNVPPTAPPTVPPSAPPSAPTSTTTPPIDFRALDLPAEYSRGSAEAVDGTTAVGWVQIGINDELPAVWDTRTGALRVLPLPDQFVHPSGETFVKLVGVSGTTAVGFGALGSPPAKRGLDRAIAWDLATGGLRILDIPAGFQRSEVHAISGTTAVGQVWTTGGEHGRSVAWNTETGAVRILDLPAGFDGNPLAVSGDTIVGIRSDLDEAWPLVWNPITGVARSLDRLPDTADGIPRAVDGTTAVGSCCFGEEGTPRPLVWNTATGAVRLLDLPAGLQYGTAVGISGTLAVGRAEFHPIVWDLATGEVSVLPAPAGYEEQYGITAVSGRVLVGTACPPPPTTAENPRCQAAAWTLP